MKRDTGGLGHLLLGQPDLAESYMRALALKGELPSYTGGEFQPSITALDLTEPEFLWTRRILRLSQGISLPAIAGQFSQAAFAPIAGASRTLAVVEQLIITNNSGVAVNVSVDSLPSALGFAPAAVPKSALDDRAIPFNALQPTPNFGWVNATAVAGLLGLGSLTVSLVNNSTFILPLNWVFTARTVLNTPAPSFLMVQVSAVNTSLVLGAVWRERALLASEAS